jgi:hypothetical protein
MLTVAAACVVWIACIIAAVCLFLYGIGVL